MYLKFSYFYEEIVLESVHLFSNSFGGKMNLDKLIQQENPHLATLFTTLWRLTLGTPCNSLSWQNEVRDSCDSCG